MQESKLDPFSSMGSLSQVPEVGLEQSSTLEVSGVVGGAFSAIGSHGSVCNTEASSSHANSRSGSPVMTKVGAGVGAGKSATSGTFRAAQSKTVRTPPMSTTPIPIGGSGVLENNTTYSAGFTSKGGQSPERALSKIEKSITQLNQMQKARALAEVQSSIKAANLGVSTELHSKGQIISILQEREDSAHCGQPTRSRSASPEMQGGEIAPIFHDTAVREVQQEAGENQSQSQSQINHTMQAAGAFSDKPLPLSGGTVGYSDAVLLALSGCRDKTAISLVQALKGAGALNLREREHFNSMKEQFTLISNKLKRREMTINSLRKQAQLTIAANTVPDGSTASLRLTKGLQTAESQLVEKYHDEVVLLNEAIEGQRGKIDHLTDVANLERKHLKAHQRTATTAELILGDKIKVLETEKQSLLNNISYQEITLQKLLKQFVEAEETIVAVKGKKDEAEYSEAQAKERILQLEVQLQASKGDVNILKEELKVVKATKIKDIDDHQAKLEEAGAIRIRYDDLVVELDKLVEEQSIQNMNCMCGGTGNRTPPRIGTINSSRPSRFISRSNAATSNDANAAEEEERVGEEERRGEEEEIATASRSKVIARPKEGTKVIVRARNNRDNNTSGRQSTAAQHQSGTGSATSPTKNSGGSSADNYSNSDDYCEHCGRDGSNGSDKLYLDPNLSPEAKAEAMEKHAIIAKWSSRNEQLNHAAHGRIFEKLVTAEDACVAAEINNNKLKRELLELQKEVTKAGEHGNDNAQELEDWKKERDTRERSHHIDVAAMRNEINQLSADKHSLHARVEVVLSEANACRLTIKSLEKKLRDKEVKISQFGNANGEAERAQAQEDDDTAAAAAEAMLKREFDVMHLKDEIKDLKATLKRAGVDDKNPMGRGSGGSSLMRRQSKPAALAAPSNSSKRRGTKVGGKRQAADSGESGSDSEPNTSSPSRARTASDTPSRINTPQSRLGTANTMDSSPLVMELAAPPVDVLTLETTASLSQSITNHLDKAMPHPELHKYAYNEWTKEQGAQTDISSASEGYTILSAFDAALNNKNFNDIDNLPKGVSVQTDASDCEYPLDGSLAFVFATFKSLVNEHAPVAALSVPSADEFNSYKLAADKPKATTLAGVGSEVVGVEKTKKKPQPPMSAMPSGSSSSVNRPSSRSARPRNTSAPPLSKVGGAYSDVADPSTEVNASATVRSAWKANGSRQQKVLLASQFAAMHVVPPVTSAEKDVTPLERLSDNQVAALQQRLVSMQGVNKEQYQTIHKMLTFIIAVNATRNQIAATISTQSSWDTRNTRMFVRCLDVIVQTLFHIVAIQPSEKQQQDQNISSSSGPLDENDAAAADVPVLALVSETMQQLLNSFEDLLPQKVEDTPVRPPPVVQPPVDSSKPVYTSADLAANYSVDYIYRHGFRLPTGRPISGTPLAGKPLEKSLLMSDSLTTASGSMHGVHGAPKGFIKPIQSKAQVTYMHKNKGVLMPAEKDVPSNKVPHQAFNPSHAPLVGKNSHGTATTATATATDAATNNNDNQASTTKQSSLIPGVREDKSKAVHTYDDRFNFASVQPTGDRNHSQRSTSPSNQDKFAINQVGMDTFLSSDLSDPEGRDGWDKPTVHKHRPGRAFSVDIGTTSATTAGATRKAGTLVGSGAIGVTITGAGSDGKHKPVSFEALSQAQKENGIWLNAGMTLGDGYLDVLTVCKEGSGIKEEKARAPAAEKNFPLAEAYIAAELQQQQQQLHREDMSEVPENASRDQYQERVEEPPAAPSEEVWLQQVMHESEAMHLKSEQDSLAPASSDFGSRKDKKLRRQQETGARHEWADRACDGGWYNTDRDGSVLPDYYGAYEKTASNTASSDNAAVPRTDDHRSSQQGGKAIANAPTDAFAQILHNLHTLEAPVPRGTPAVAPVMTYSSVDHSKPVGRGNLLPLGKQMTFTDAGADDADGNSSVLFCVSPVKREGAHVGPSPSPSPPKEGRNISRPNKARSRSGGNHLRSLSPEGQGSITIASGDPVDDMGSLQVLSSPPAQELLAHMPAKVLQSAHQDAYNTLAQVLVEPVPLLLRNAKTDAADMVLSSRQISGVKAPDASRSNPSSVSATIREERHEKPVGKSGRSQRAGGNPNYPRPVLQTEPPV